jgi:hypothetical protein
MTHVSFNNLFSFFNLDKLLIFLVKQPLFKIVSLFRDIPVRAFALWAYFRLYFFSCLPLILTAFTFISSDGNCYFCHIPSHRLYNLIFKYCCSVIYESKIRYYIIKMFKYNSYFLSILFNNIKKNSPEN